MKYYTAKAYLKDIEKLQNLLKGSHKNNAIAIYRDYYSGNQWGFDNGYGEVTRAGKVMYESKQRADNKPMENGKLKVWNVVQPVVDIYASYGRGTSDDQTEINIDNDEALTSIINDKYSNMDELILRLIRRMSIDSILCVKHEVDSPIEVIDSLEIFPIYLGNRRVGTIRQYNINENDPIIADKTIIGKNKNIYTEVIIKLENQLNDPIGKYEMYQFVGSVQLNDPEVIDYDPYIIVANKKDEFHNFDEDNTEISDVGQIIDIQDDINAYMTDITIINRQVAIPMWKLTDRIMEAVANGTLDGEKLKGELQNLQIMAGKIISAPIERLSGEGMPDSSIKYIDYLFEQLYRITGIPKSLFVSEGMGNISTDTMEFTIESMKRRIDEKRTAIETLIKEDLLRSLIDTNNVEKISSISDDVQVQWADMISMSKNDRANMLNTASNVLPNDWVMEKFVELLGESEDLNRIIGMANSNSLTTKIAYERTKIQERIAQENKKKLEEEAKKSQEAVRQRDAVTGEMVKLVSQL